MAQDLAINLTPETALAGHDPTATNEVLVRGLPQRVKSSLRTRKQNRFTDHGLEIDFLGYEWTGDKPALVDLRAALDVVRSFLPRSSTSLIAEELTRLRVGTKARPETTDDVKILMAVYAEQLAEYPPDVLRAGVRQWLRKEIFFPAVAELHGVCERLGERRVILARTLEREIAAQEASEKSP